MTSSFTRGQEARLGMSLMAGWEMIIFRLVMVRLFHLRSLVVMGMMLFGVVPAATILTEVVATTGCRGAEVTTRFMEESAKIRSMVIVEMICSLVMMGMTILKVMRVMI